MTVTRDGVRIWVETRGKGSPLVLIHGLGMSTKLWRDQIEPFGAHHRTVALDLRGFGRSDRPTGRGVYAIEEMARDVAAVVRTLPDASAHVLGTSMGGFVALALALAEPARCRSLVLCHTAARMSIPADVLASRLEALAHVSMEEYGRLIATQALGLSSPELFDWVAGMVAANDRAAYAQVLTEGLAAFDVTARVGEIDLPTLVVVGERDRVIPAAEGRALAAKLPHAEVVTLPGVGHLGYAERPPDFNAAVLGFLARQR
jgi:pimeloyl-ACP methyl ester carboxylesterase